MSDKLKALVKQAGIDANRAHDLTTAITILQLDPNFSAAKIEINFPGSTDGYRAGDLMEEELKRSWLTIRQNALDAAKAELKVIMDRYAPLIGDDQEARFAS